MPVYEIGLVNLRTRAVTAITIDAAGRRDAKRRALAIERWFNPDAAFIRPYRCSEVRPESKPHPARPS